VAKPESPSTDGSAGSDPSDARAEKVSSPEKAAGSGKDTKATKVAKVAKTKPETSSSRSGNPAKAASAKSGRSGATTKISKREEKRVFDDPTAGPRFSVRAALSLLLVLAGIAWIAYYYLAVRADPATGAEPTGPGFMGDLADWNYLIGFAAFFLGLVLAAHPSTPLGRGRGVVVGMLFCFLFGLAWICTFYAVTANPDALPVFDDLGQKNLFVGIAAMGVGFVYATRWE